MAVKIKMWDKESSLGGWSRIVASATQIGTAIAITANNPEATPDLADLGNLGEGLINAGHQFYVAAGLFATGIITAYSKFVSAFKK